VIGAVTREQQPQTARQLIMVCRVQTIQNPAFSRHQFCQCGIYRLPASICQLDENAAPVVWVILPGNEASVGEPVYPIGHRSGCDERFSKQLPRRQPVRRA
jgi:hypothetical protein